MSLTNSTLGSNNGSYYMIKVLCRQKTGLNICHINAQSLKRKIDEFRHNFEMSGVDIICVSETWFNSSITDSIISVEGYNVYRNDRSSLGGGVALYVKNNLPCKVIFKSEQNEKIESIFVELVINTRKILLGCAYRPNCHIPYECIFDTILDISVHYDDVIIAGDLNSNLLKEKTLIESFNSMGLYGVNTTIPTHYTTTSNSLIDIFLVSKSDNVLLYDQLSMPCFSKHDLIFLTYDAVHTPEQKQTSYFNFNKINYDTLASEIHNIDWSKIYDIYSTDDQLTFLSENLLYLLDCTVPICTPRPRKAQNCWFSESIKKLIDKRDLAYRRWKRFKCPMLHEEYRTLRTDVNKTINRAKAGYYANKFRQATDSKKKWKTIREIGVGSTPIVEIDANPDELNASFLNSTTYLEDNNIETNPINVISNTPAFPDFTTFEFACIRPIDVYEGCMSIKSNAVGLDNLHPKFIKSTLPYTLSYITYFFNTILTTGKYPTTWKHSKVIPVPKSKNGNEYRPISILPFFSKAFEKIIHKQISAYLNEHRLLSSKQSGFRPRHSCVTALIDVTEDIRSNIDDGLATCLVLLDHSKAFDCVNHELLCLKLKHYFNFSASAVLLVKNYLCQRTQSVVIKDIMSKSLQLNKGVPQGSILGPLLFSMYINDLPPRLRYSSIHIYADDVQLYLSFAKPEIRQGFLKINEDLGIISNWAHANYLNINPKKSNCILISNRNHNIITEEHILIGEQHIQLVEKAKNLGITFNNSLTWTDHIVATTGKIFGMLRTLYQTQSFTPKHIRLLLAKTYLLPVLCYGSELFSKCDSRSTRRLETAHNAIIRYVHGLNRYESCSPYEKSICNMKFGDFLDIKNLLLLHKIIYEKCPEYLYQKLQFGRTNRRILLVMPRYRLLISQWQYLTNAIRLWNSLPLSIQSICNANSFKKALQKNL